MAADEWRWLRPAAVAALGLLAVLQAWLVDRRPEAPERRVAAVLVVTSGADAGPGSLREAIFAAARAPGRTRIVLRAPRIAVETSLPPLLHPDGVVIEGTAANEIDATALDGEVTLDLAAPGSELRGFTVRGDAGEGIVVRAPGARLSGVGLIGFGVGVLAGGGAAELVVEGGRFEDNGVGIRLESGRRLAAVRGCRFSGHREAAIWAVPSDREPASGARVSVTGNRFSGDRISLVLGEVAAEVSDNDLAGARETAIFLLGGAAVVRENRIRSGPGVGIYASATNGALIADNEIDRFAGAAIIVHSCGNTVVRDNRVSACGYGIAHVFGEPGRPDVIAGNLLLGQRLDGIYVVGGSPVVRGNRVLGSGGAGLRVLDFVSVGVPPRVAGPLVEGNTFEANGADRPARGEYREAPPTGGRSG